MGAAVSGLLLVNPRCDVCERRHAPHQAWHFWSYDTSLARHSAWTDKYPHEVVRYDFSTCTRNAPGCAPDAPHVGCLSPPLRFKHHNTRETWMDVV
jgi:hypothetical protein